MLLHRRDAVVIFGINLSRTYIGRAWVAIRDRDIAAAAAGINVARFKLLAFMISRGLAALAGSLGAYFTTVVTVEAYTLELAILYLAMIIVGGMGSIAGSVLGAAFMTLLPFAIERVFEGLPMASRHHLLRRPGGRHRRRDHRLPVVRAEGPDRDLPPHRRIFRAMAVPLSRAATGRAALMSEPLLDVRQTRGGLSPRRHRGAGHQHRGCARRIVAMIGTNGAGKTTTLRAVSGFLPAEDVAITDGTISFDGRPLRGLLPHQISRLGVVLVPERNKVFETLSVQENLNFSLTRRRGRPRPGLRLLSAAGGAAVAGRRLSQRRREADAGDRHGARLRAEAAAGR